MPRLGDGRGKGFSLCWLSATSRVLPSTLTKRQSRYQAPFVVFTAMGVTTSSWSCFSVSHHSLVRACEIPDLPATFTSHSGPSNHLTPSSKQRSTSRYETCMYRVNAMT